jgi:hypothetical protein
MLHEGQDQVRSGHFHTVALSHLSLSVPCALQE